MKTRVLLFGLLALVIATACVADTLVGTVSCSGPRGAGNVVKWTAWVVNLPWPGSCDVTNVDATLYLPAADGTPTGPTMIVDVGGYYVPGDSAKRSQTQKLTLNAGVTQATALLVITGLTLDGSPVYYDAPLTITIPN